MQIQLSTFPKAAHGQATVKRGGVAELITKHRSRHAFDLTHHSPPPQNLELGERVLYSNGGRSSETGVVRVPSLIYTLNVGTIIFSFL